MGGWQTLTSTIVINMSTLCVNYNKIHNGVGRYVYGYLLDSKITEGIVLGGNNCYVSLALFSCDSKCGAENEYITISFS